jgi:hypothetical protein
VPFLISLSGNFLDFFCGGIVSYFRLKPRWVLMLGGRVQKTDGVPEHKYYEQQHANHKEGGDKESLKACPRLKSCESLYTCPRAPFYRETKGLLHSKITRKSREYS